MKINPINSGNIPFLKKKQVKQKPIVACGDTTKMIPDEEVDKKSIIPKWRIVAIKEYEVIKGDESVNGSEEK